MTSTMTRKRPAGFDLREAIRSVSFTPGARDFGALVEMLGADEDAASDAEKALLRAGDGEEGARGRKAIGGAVGKIGGEPARAVLGGAEVSAPELQRVVGEALMVLGRRASRGAEAGIDPEGVAERVPASPFELVVRC